jgi:hypothetical protein
MVYGRGLLLGRGVRVMKYADGSPIPVSHQEWFNSGVIDIQTLEECLNIIRINEEREANK